MSTKVQTAPKTESLMEQRDTRVRRKQDKVQNRRNPLPVSANVVTGVELSSGTVSSGNPNNANNAVSQQQQQQQQQHKKNKHDSDSRHFKSNRKRAQSFNSSSGKFFPPYKRRKKEGGIVPPTKFLLGGNICDPLNLNSLQDEEINRAMNAVTPKSSPLPTPTHRKGQVEVIIPPNIYDPLNLAACDDDAEYEAMLISPVKKSQKKQKKSKKRKHSKSLSGPGSGKEDAADDARLSGDEKKLSEGEDLSTSHENADVSAETVTTNVCDDVTCDENNSALTILRSATESAVADDIAAVNAASAPVATKTEDIAIPTASQPANDADTRNNLKSALNLDLDVAVNAGNKPSQPSPVIVKDNRKDMLDNSGGGGGNSSNSNCSNIKKIRKELKDKIVSPVIPQPGAWGDPRNHYYRSQPQRLTPQINKGQATPKFKENNSRFQYGNYNRYYGYRNANEECDVRFKVLAKRRDLFEGKDILDVGSNVGHMTLLIARDLNPKKIVGVEIDRSLVDAAKKNIRHYLNPRDKQYPVSMPVVYGPVNVPSTSKADQNVFPNNISFVQGNYVLESDVLLTMEQPQFDTILCLSVTKWFHLNWGDDGLKRAFKRMYAQLRPGGVLILEPQAWHSYKKKRNLTPQIWNNYKNIELFPHKFSQYLLSEVGFTKCETMGAPVHQSRGFQRAIKLFTKGELIVNNPSTSRAVNEPSATVTSSVEQCGDASVAKSDSNDRPAGEVSTADGGGRFTVCRANSDTVSVDVTNSADRRLNDNITITSDRYAVHIKVSETETNITLDIETTKSVENTDWT